MKSDVVLDKRLLLKELFNSLTMEEYMELSESVRDRMGELVDEKED